jgi:hypothetical protein
MEREEREKKIRKERKKRKGEKMWNFFKREKFLGQKEKTIYEVGLKIIFVK